MSTLEPLAISKRIEELCGLILNHESTEFSARDAGLSDPEARLIAFSLLIYALDSLLKEGTIGGNIIKRIVEDIREV